jgi:hypothetical protein
MSIPFFFKSSSRSSLSYALSPISFSGFASILPLLAALRLADPLASTFRRSKRRIDEALRFINVSLLAKHIGQIRQYVAKHFAPTPMLKTTINRLVVRITLWQHMPLGTRGQLYMRFFVPLTNGILIVFRTMTNR